LLCSNGKNAVKERCISINGSILSRAGDDKIDATPAVECSLESLQACDAQPACAVVARSRGVRACRCDAVDAPAGCEPAT